MIMEAQDHVVYRDEQVTMIELACDNAAVLLTPGKIVLWFGRKASESLIHHVIFGISSIDSSVTHECEIVCDFNAISEYENMGYVLTSYAKTKGGYRVILNVPFSKKLALAHFVESIVSQLKEKDVRKILHWNGSVDRMTLISNALKKLDGWEIKQIAYKEKIK